MVLQLLPEFGALVDNEYNIVVLRGGRCNGALIAHPLKLVKLIKRECSVLKKIIMDENDALSKYNKIPLGHNRSNGDVYSKIYFKVEICSAH